MNSKNRKRQQKRGKRSAPGSKIWRREWIVRRKVKNNTQGSCWW